MFKFISQLSKFEIIFVDLYEGKLLRVFSVQANRQRRVDADLVQDDAEDQLLKVSKGCVMRICVLKLAEMCSKSFFGLILITILLGLRHFFGGERYLFPWFSHKYDYVCDSAYLDGNASGFTHVLHHHVTSVANRAFLMPFSEKMAIFDTWSIFLC